MIFIGDGSVCSTTSSTDNGGDVDAFLLQVRNYLFIVDNLFLIINC